MNPVGFVARHISDMPQSSRVSAAHAPALYSLPTPAGATHFTVAAWQYRGVSIEGAVDDAWLNIDQPNTPRPYSPSPSLSVIHA